MSRQRPTDERDRGATLALIAIMLTVLLGCGAIVIDLGFLYVERRQLQNGADAAALAVAQDCAAGNCLDEWGTARTAASANATSDDVSAVDVVCGGGPTAAQVGLATCVGPTPPGITNALGWVKVTTSTLTSTGSTKIPFLLGVFIGANGGKTVHATAIAAWGTASGGLALPFVMAECAFNGLGGSLLSSTIPQGLVTVFSEKLSSNGPGSFSNSELCRNQTNSLQLPGSFGWLSADGECLLNLNVNVPTYADPGNDSLIKKNCGDGSSVRDQTVLLAIYNAYSGTGSNATYNLVSFVGFRVTGYHLSGDTWPGGFACPPNPYDPSATGSDVRCFQGYFTQVYPKSGDFGSGAAYDLGVRTIKMIG